MQYRHHHKANKERKEKRIKQTTKVPKLKGVDTLFENMTGPPHLALNPPYFVLFFCCGGGFLFFLEDKQKKHLVLLPRKKEIWVYF